MRLALSVGFLLNEASLIASQIFTTVVLHVHGRFSFEPLLQSFIEINSIHFGLVDGSTSMSDHMRNTVWNKEAMI